MWAPTNQFKILKEKIEVPWRRRKSTSWLPLDLSYHSTSFLGLQHFSRPCRFWSKINFSLSLLVCVWRYICMYVHISQFSCSVMSDSLQPHGLQHPRLPCPSPTPRACSNSCPWSWWCQLTISSCHPHLLPSSIFPSIRIFSNESVLRIRWPKYLSFSFSICPSNECSGLISFRMNWLDLLVVQGTLKNLQHHSSKSSILWCSPLYSPTLISIHECWKNHSFD